MSPYRRKQRGRPRLVLLKAYWQIGVELAKQAARLASEVVRAVHAVNHCYRDWRKAVREA